MLDSMIVARITDHSVTVDGHAQEDEHAEYLSICTAASVLVQTAYGAMWAVAEVQAANYKQVDGHISFSLPEHNGKALTILKTLAVGLSWLAESYPGAVYVHVDDELASNGTLGTC